MLKIEFTLEEIDTLEYERYHHPDPKVQRKAEVLYPAIIHPFINNHPNHPPQAIRSS